MTMLHWRQQTLGVLTASRRKNFSRHRAISRGELGVSQVQWLAHGVTDATNLAVAQAEISSLLPTLRAPRSGTSCRGVWRLTLKDGSLIPDRWDEAHVKRIQLLRGHNVCSKVAGERDNRCWARGIVLRKMPSAFSLVSTRLRAGGDVAPACLFFRATV